MAKKAKSSVLKRQKPKRAKKQPLGKRLKFYGGIALIAMGVGAISYGAYQFKTQGVFVADRSDRIDWKVSIKAADEQQLPTERMEEITATTPKVQWNHHMTTMFNGSQGASKKAKRPGPVRNWRI